MAQHLGISREEVHDHCQVLEAHGLITKPADRLTPDQRRVLDALPSTESGQTVTTRELAEQLGMDQDEVKEHLRVLNELGWIGDEQ